MKMALDIQRIKAICFDVDGTLSDTDDLFVQRIVRILKPMKFVFRGNDPNPFARKFVMFTESPGNLLFGIPDRLGIDPFIALLGDMVYRLGIRKSPKPFLIIPGIMDLLLLLQPLFPMSIVSARGERSTKMFLDQFNLNPFFISIATAQTCKHTKPYPDPIIWSSNKMNVSPDECLMIGDTTVDIKAAKAAGAQSIGVLCGFGEKSELVRAGADLILKNTTNLSKILLLKE
jgi:phosphoglycolate phosphatase-like HAD superfamily hydrolase